MSRMLRVERTMSVVLTPSWLSAGEKPDALVARLESCNGVATDGDSPPTHAGLPLPHRLNAGQTVASTSRSTSFKRPKTIASRRAFSLLEVIIATGILAGSTMLLLGLFSTGQRHGQRAEERVVAQMLCQSKLDELLAAATDLQMVEDAPVEGFLEWTWSADWEPTSFAGLVRVRVQVRKVGEVSQAMAGASRPVERLNSDAAPPDFELVRWMRFDPSALAQQATANPQDRRMDSGGEAVFTP